MSTAVLARPTARARTARVASPRAGEDRPTLEGVIARAWEGLAAHRGVGCPICGGHMTPRYGASGMEPVGGRCSDCGTTLA